jgi:hypothetical protein
LVKSPASTLNVVTSITLTASRAKYKSNTTVLV